MNIQPRTPAEFAALENAAARRRWDDTDDQRKVPKKNILKRVRPFIGSGMKKAEIARILDCSGAAVYFAFKKLGAEP